MTPMTAEEKIEQLTKATRLAQDTIRELNEARASTVDILKQHKNRITQLIEEEVRHQTEYYEVEAKEKIREAVENVIETLTKTLEERLAL